MNNINQQDMDAMFESKRNNLLALLDKADEIVNKIDKSEKFPAIYKDLRSQIDDTRKRCYEGLFSIALIAAFQSGKSTTLNTFSDGREIAPRGLGGGGIKTSACLVKVQNPNEGEDETVIVSWRKDEDLLLQLDEILGSTACLIPNSEDSKKLREIKKQRDSASDEKNQAIYEDQYLSIIDFRTSKGKFLLEQALSNELQNYKENNQKGSEMQDKLDLLRFAMIVLAYHDEPKLQEFKKKDYFQPEEIQSYLKFPEKFEERWNECFSSFSVNLTKQKFSLEEVMYAFIEEVTYIVNSENIKKSGSVIVDCPGLFVSEYDTRIAISAMQNSSAIWYLINGDKQLSQSDKKTLNFIQTTNQGHKVFFGINYKDNRDTPAAKNVVSTILEQLKDLGFSAYHQTEPLYFNAFLALRAMQGEKLLKNELDEYTRKQICLDASAMTGKDFESVEQAWLESVQDVMLKVLDGQRKRDVFSLEFEAKTVEYVKNESNWDQATDKIKKYVFDTKAYFILVDQGCQPVIDTLEQAEGSLKTVENNAKKSQEQAEQEWDEARKKLALFKQECQDMLDGYITDAWDNILARDFWEKVLIPSIKSTGDSSATPIVDEATLLGVLGSLGTKIVNNIADGINWLTGSINEAFGTNIDQIPKGELLEEKCKKIIHDEFERNLNTKALGWFNSLKKGGNQQYEEKILKKIVDACIRMEKKWGDLNLNHNSYLQGLDVNIPKFSGDVRKDIERYDIKFDQAVNVAVQKSWEDLVIFSTSFVYLFGIDLIFPGLGTLLTTIVVFVIIIITRFKPREEYSKEVASKITEEMEKGVRINTTHIIDKLENKLCGIREFYWNSIQNSFSVMTKQLNQRIEEASNNLKKTQKEREETAISASIFRAKEIEPLRREIEQFKSSVEAIWSKSS